MLDGVLVAYTGPGGDVVVPAGTVRIGRGAFRDNAALRTIHLPEGLEEIDDHAFRNCANLRQIRIPADCTLGTDVFEQCRLVYIYGAAGSLAEAYCAEHENCVFVEE